MEIPIEFHICNKGVWCPDHIRYAGGKWEIHFSVKAWLDDVRHYYILKLTGGAWSEQGTVDYFCISRWFLDIWGQHLTNAGKTNGKENYNWFLLLNTPFISFHSEKLKFSFSSFHEIKLFEWFNWMIWLKRNIITVNLANVNMR